MFRFLPLLLLVLFGFAAASQVGGGINPLNGCGTDPNGIPKPCQ
jgi:hypothetical protein